MVEVDALDKPTATRKKSDNRGSCDNFRVID
jgi:hypothetical protein